MGAMFAAHKEEPIKNMPAYAAKYRYIVARRAGDWDDLWFYGAWDEAEKAQEVAKEIDGVVIENF